MVQVLVANTSQLVEIIIVKPLACRIKPESVGVYIAHLLGYVAETVIGVVDILPGHILRNVGAGHYRRPAHKVGAGITVADIRQPVFERGVQLARRHYYRVLLARQAVVPVAHIAVAAAEYSHGRQAARMVAVVGVKGPARIGVGRAF